MSVMDYYPSKKETMQKIKIEIDGVTKNLVLLDMDKEAYKAAHFIGGKWYGEGEEKDYEILSFKTFLSVWTKNSIGNYESDFGGLTPIFGIDKMLGYLKNGSVDIHSVKRLSDGEVFTVETDHTDYEKITKIYIEDNKIWLKIENGLSVALKGAVKKVTTPTILITTHDGVKVTSPNQLLYICHKNFNRGECFANFISTNQNNIYFYHHKSREDYIQQNKPVPVSCIELAKAITFTSPQLDLLVAFFKRKQTVK